MRFLSLILLLATILVLAPVALASIIDDAGIQAQDRLFDWYGINYIQQGVRAIRGDCNVVVADVMVSLGRKTPYEWHIYLWVPDRGILPVVLPITPLGWRATVEVGE